MRPCTCDKIGPADFDVNSGNCYTCWCWYYRKEIRIMWGGPEEQPDLPEGTHTEPGLLQKMANLGKSLAEHALNGFKNAPEDVQRIRLDLCEACEEFTDERTCKACGCYMDIKTKWAAMKCPKGRWAAHQEDVKPTESCGCQARD